MRRHRHSRLRGLTLVLLWLWVVCVFVVVDLFLNVGEFDSIRPRAALYRAMRWGGHDLVGEPYTEDDESSVAPVPVSGELTVWCEQYEDGGAPRTTSERRTDVHGRSVLHGRFTAWHGDGTRSAEGHFVDGRKDGHWDEWYLGGQRRLHCEFRNGQPVGRWTAWHEGGHVWWVLEFRGGRIADGIWTTWHDNGAVAAIAEYHSGEIDGSVSRFDRDGVRIEDLEYRGGKIVRRQHYRRAGETLDG